MEETEEIKKENLTEKEEVKCKFKCFWDYLVPLGALMGIIFFFTPWIGCDNFNLSGYDLAKHYDDQFFKGDPSIWLVITGAVILLLTFIYSKIRSGNINIIKIISFISSLFPLLFIIYKFRKIPGDDGIKIKYGLILTLLGFLISLIGTFFYKDNTIKLSKQIKA